MGRLIFFKYCAISVLVILVSLILVIKLSLPNEPLGNSFMRLIHILLENSFFWIIQTWVTFLVIWLLGGIISFQLIHKDRNPLLIGGLAFLILWLVLFLTSALTESTIDAFEMEKFYFSVTFDRWMDYHLKPFFLMGIIHGLTVGFFLGREIKNKGRKQSGQLQST